MSKVERQAANRAADPSGKAYTRDTVTSAERIEIPAEMKGTYCEFTMRGVSWTAWKFGDGTVTVDAATASALASEVLTAGGDEPDLMVFADSAEPFWIPADASHMAHISDATGGKNHFGNKTGASE